MECTTAKATKSRELLIQAMKRKMDKRGLHNAIITLIVWGMRWYPGKGAPKIAGSMDGKVDSMITKALEE